MAQTSVDPAMSDSKEDKGLHVVLGASGVIGLGVLAELKKREIPAVGVARTKREGWIQADLTDSAQLLEACRGATHIYLCAGLEYNTAVWRESWPKIMDNTLAAAEAYSAKVVFVDNIYMYGPPPLRHPITEDHPEQPSSEKGKIRKQIANCLLEADQARRVRSLIARAPDFYGPGAKNSLLSSLMLDNIAKGKGPMWLGNPRLVHSFGYVGDISRAMVLLALDPGAYGQVWHTPTSHEPVTAIDLHRMLAKELRSNSRLMAIPTWAIPVLKLLIPPLREVQEMAYQYSSDYVFSSAKFERRYPAFVVTSYEDGIKAMVAAAKADGSK